MIVLWLLLTVFIALQGGELNKAEQLLHVALKMAQDTINQQAVTYIFDLLANLAYQREEYPKAERLFKDVLQRLLSGVCPCVVCLSKSMRQFGCIHDIEWVVVA